jgi:hypothetical protein
MVQLEENAASAGQTCWQSSRFGLDSILNGRTIVFSPSLNAFSFIPNPSFADSSNPPKNVSPRKSSEFLLYMRSISQTGGQEVSSEGIRSVEQM